MLDFGIARLVSTQHLSGEPPIYQRYSGAQLRTEGEVAEVSKNYHRYIYQVASIILQNNNVVWLSRLLANVELQRSTEYNPYESFWFRNRNSLQWAQLFYDRKYSK